MDGQAHQAKPSEGDAPSENFECSATFIQELSDAQPRLYNFIHSRLMHSATAEDVLQETNMVICEKAHQFVAGTNFNAWVFKIAHFQIMAQKKRFVRGRIHYDDELLDLLIEEEEQHSEFLDEKLSALSQCLGKLKPEQRDLVTRRYGENVSVQILAQEAQKKCNALSQTLSRIRQTLMKCIEKSMGSEPS